VRGRPGFKAFRLLVLTAFSVLCLGLAAGAAMADESSSPVAGPSSSPGGTVLRVGWESNIDSLNPFVGQSTEAYSTYHLNYDFLVQYDAATLEPIPGLAESWSHSSDGKTWTFKLRHDVTWQDGEPFTAKDVAFTFNYVIDNEMGSYAGYTKGITKVVATDDYTVDFTCDKPKATMLQMWVPILPEHVWSKVSPKDAANKFQNLPPCIGTGPFQVVEWKPGVFVRMKANKDYWGGAPKTDELIFTIYTNNDTLASDLSSGLIQFAGVTPAAFQKLKNDPAKTAQFATYQAYDNIGFNCYKGPSRGHPACKDPKFRSALAWAIDTKTIAAIAYGGAAAPATSILPADYWPKDADFHWQPPASELRTYDPAKANELLDEAGYKDTDGDGIRDYKGKPIKLRLWASNERGALGMAGKLIAGYLMKVGLKIEYQAMDPAAMNEGVYAYKDGKFNPDYDMFCWGWMGDYDPGFLLSLLLTSQIESWSDTGWSNAEYDRLYAAQDSELDPVKRLELVHQMQEIIYDECPYIATVYPQLREVFDSEHWTGWTRMPAVTGSVDNRWTFRNVEPKAGATADEGGAKGVVIVVVIVVIVVAVAVVWVLVRRRSAKLEID
jgi:peptide/nickel transport system substrate-binding protein